jgi:hypothetical protein
LAGAWAAIAGALVPAATAAAANEIVPLMTSRLFIFGSPLSLTRLRLTASQIIRAVQQELEMSPLKKKRRPKTPLNIDCFVV